jgi:ribosomal protein S18 acetylase RimI-like enzyme
MNQPILFTPIDLARHAELCIQFRRDSYRCSFPDGAQRFNQENGEDGQGYLDWLRERIAELPQGCVHVLQGQQIVGQIEMRLRQKVQMGYINLFYLIPEVRGIGLGDELQRYAVKVFQELGVDKAQLSVSPTNDQAMAYYRKHGWHDLGQRSDNPNVHLMELTIR